jgi:hypothetical protein
MSIGGVRRNVGPVFSKKIAGRKNLDPVTRFRKRPRSVERPKNYPHPVEPSVTNPSEGDAA